MAGSTSTSTSTSATAGNTGRGGRSTGATGTGTGGTTGYVLEALAGRDVSYLFTDISPAFVQAARERFQHNPGFRSQVLDIEKDPASQGLSGRQFDLVIAEIDEVPDKL